MDLGLRKTKIRSFKEGQKRYIYDSRASDNVCKAHILKVLPHPDAPDEQLIVYRWYGKHKRYWWYGVTQTWTQRVWADYIKKTVDGLREKRKKEKVTIQI